jgi:hypothetical protein
MRLRRVSCWGRRARGFRTRWLVLRHHARLDRTDHSAVPTGPSGTFGWGRPITMRQPCTLVVGPCHRSSAQVLSPICLDFRSTVVHRDNDRPFPVETLLRSAHRGFGLAGEIHLRTNGTLSSIQPAARPRGGGGAGDHANDWRGALAGGPDRPRRTYVREDNRPRRCARLRSEKGDEESGGRSGPESNNVEPWVISPGKEEWRC